jgi:hypothetical protein
VLQGAHDETDPDETEISVLPVKIDGLPAHVLLIHAVVVLLPVTAVMLMVGAVWPTARRKLGFLTPALALVVLILVPVTTHAGEWLRDRLPDTPAIRKHADLGGSLLPWAAGIFVVAAAIWLLGRRFEMSWRPSATDEAPRRPAGDAGTATMVRPGSTRMLPVWVTAVAAVLAVFVSVGGLVQLYRIGDSGAKAVWSGVADQPVQSGSGGS